MRPTRLLCAALLLALAAAPATAAGGWGAPTAIAGAGGYAPMVVFEPGGAGAVLWDSASAGADTRPAIARISGDAVGTPHLLTRAPSELTETGALVALPRAGTLLAVSNTPTAPSRPRATFLNLDGRVRSIRLIATRPAGLSLLEPAALASNRAGTAATLLERCTTGNCASEQLYLAIERGRDAFLRPIELATVHGPIAAGAVSVNGSGVVLAAWQGQEGVYARERKASGKLTPITRLGRTADLGPTLFAHSPPPYRPYTVLSADVTVAALLTHSGRGVVAWEGEGVDHGTGDPHTPATAFAASSNVHGGFGRAQRLARFTYEREGSALSQPALALTQTSDGTVLAAWTARAGGHFVVRAATPRVSSPAYRFGRAQTLSSLTSDAYLAQLAAGPSGQAVVLWTSAPPDPGGGPNTDQAQLWSGWSGSPNSAGPEFSPPVAASPVGTILSPSIAFDFHTGDAVVAWEGADSNGYPQIETATHTP